MADSIDDWLCNYQMAAAIKDRPSWLMAVRNHTYGTDRRLFAFVHARAPPLALLMIGNYADRWYRPVANRRKVSAILPVSATVISSAIVPYFNEAELERNTYRNFNDHDDLISDLRSTMWTRHWNSNALIHTSPMISRWVVIYIV